MEPSRRCICYSCVKEIFLSKKIKHGGITADCYYCKEFDVKCIKIVDLADEIAKAFEQHYERTPTEPDGYEYAMLKHSGRDWYRDGEEVLYAIQGAADIEEAPARDILDILEEVHYNQDSAEMGQECPFDSDSYYIERAPDCDAYHRKWHEFEHSLKSETRFFSKFAQDTLEDLFSDVANLRTRTGAPVIQVIGPNAEIASLYRARVFQSRNDLLKSALAYPWKELGPPPSLAATAGRMNARGISVFYGSTSADTAIAEVRPPVGSRVAVAKFDVIRSLRLLDVRKMNEVFTKGSIFDPDYLRQLQRSKFLGHLSRRITRPVMPDDEAFDYLATQAIADYLATECKLDGILFPSVQIGDKAKVNIVLFHHAAGSEIPELPKNTEIKVSLESYDEDASPEYDVREDVTPVAEQPEPIASSRLWAAGHNTWNVDDIDLREASLRVDTQQIFVHHITAVNFISTPYEVRRHRFDKVESAFLKTEYTAEPQDFL